MGARCLVRVEKDAAGHTVNRLETIGWNGGCTDTNEFNYLRRENHARAGVGLLQKIQLPGFDDGPTVSSLGATFGRGAMTNGWIDIKNDRHDKLTGMEGIRRKTIRADSSGRLKPSGSATQR